MSQTEAPLVVVVRWDPMATSGNARMHHMARYQAEQRAKAAARLAWAQAGSPAVNEPVRVSLVVRRARGMDLQNVWTGVKGLVDGLFTDAVTPNDGRSWIAELGGVRMEIGKQYQGKEEVVFVIERLTAPLAAPSRGPEEESGRREGGGR